MRRILGSIPFCIALVLFVLPARAQENSQSKIKREAPGPITEQQLRASAKNLEQIALAFHNFQDAHGELPTNLLSVDNTPLLSWRVRILPLLDQEELYKQFKIDEPWDSEHNKKLIDKM